MSKEDLKAYVTKADGKVVRIKILDRALTEHIKNLGFVFDNGLSEFTVETVDNVDKGQLFSMLRDLEICFSAGKEWCPSEVFEYLREQGLCEGSFKKVSWLNPREYRISEG